jgi:peptide/nickel transport system ATP-binding protein/oligopeptide transport system ATP-binding protein
MTALLELKNLTVTFETDDGPLKAVDRVSFHLDQGQIVGLVGESGCGKSVTALSILKLIPSPPGFIKADSIRFKEFNLLQMPPDDMRKIRGKAISMIFQEPMAALSPLHRIGNQIVEALSIHDQMSKDDALKYAKKWLEKVRIPDPEERLMAYPFHLSGGMQQRIMIAMALMMDPDLVIADEPTTALDVTIQAQVFDLIRKMKQRHTSILLITHDMGVIWEMCDRVIVMYASRVVEEAKQSDIFSNPAHPYTQGLLRSIPKLSERGQRLKAISGQVPSPFHYPSGCHFRNRCPYAFERCKKEEPDLIHLKPGHRAACFLLEKG